MHGRKFWIVGLVALIVPVGCAKMKASPISEAPVEVLYTTPTSDDITDYENFIGHTDAVNTVEVRARVTGYLDKVNFNDGDEVEKGALLFQIDDRPYKAEYEKTLATLDQGKARLARLTKDHDRAVILLGRDAIGREEFDRINGDFQEGKALVSVYQAAVERSKLDLDFTQVTAPLSGRLSRRMVDPGNLVKADETALTSIVSLDPMYVYFDVDERTTLNIRRLIAEKRMKSRQEAEVPVLVGLSDEPDFPHKGTINFSDNKVDSGTGTLRVRGIISNPKPRILSPGLYTKIRLPIGNPRKSLMIEEQAITSEQSSKSVFVIRQGTVEVPDRLDPTKKVKVQGDVAYAQPIKVGSMTNGYRAVLDGLGPNDRVVISGLQRIRSGQLVTPVLAKRDQVLPLQVAGAAAPNPPSPSPAAPPATTPTPDSKPATH